MRSPLTILSAVVATVILVMPSPGARAGWSSSGGELLRDDHNPWFLGNTSEVTYCLAIDEANFGVAQARAEAAFREALAYWARNLRLIEGKRHPLATQRFTSAGLCVDGAEYDLRVQLGVLSDAQRAILGYTRRLVSIAVRTDYDPTLLKGRGFIYVTPQEGALRFDDPSVRPQVWSRGLGALEKILTHELGHVFGLKHESGIVQFDNVLTDRPAPPLMAEDFAEYVVKHRHFFQVAMVGDRLATSARGRAVLRIMTDGSPLEREMGLDWPGMIVVYDIHRNVVTGDVLRIDVSFARSNPRSWVQTDLVPIGRIEGFRTTRTDHETAVGVYVTAQQTVLPADLDGNRGYPASKNVAYTMERFAEGGAFFPDGRAAPTITNLRVSLAPNRLVLWRGPNDGSESTTIHWHE